jgi:hypothetical protein
MSVSVYPHITPTNDSWYCHGTWVLLNGILYKPIPSAIPTEQPLRMLTQNFNVRIYITILGWGEIESTWYVNQLFGLSYQQQLTWWWWWWWCVEVWLEWLEEGSTRRKTALQSLNPPQNATRPTWPRTWAAGGKAASNLNTMSTSMPETTVKKIASGCHKHPPSVIRKSGRKNSWC